MTSLLINLGHLLEKKIYVFIMFKIFKQHAEKQSQCNLKILSINGEGQYIFIKFKEF